MTPKRSVTHCIFFLDMFRLYGHLLNFTDLYSQDSVSFIQDYKGPKPDEEQQRKLERALEDKVGKLNAAIALYLMAHSGDCSLFQLACAVHQTVHKSCGGHCKEHGWAVVSQSLTLARSAKEA